MAASAKRTFNLLADQAKYIDNLVASGTYATGSEVVRAGLEALQDREATIEQWLRDEVVPVVKAMEADPERGIPIEQVRKNLKAHRAARARKAAGGA